jgi:hypothetical protein
MMLGLSSTRCLFFFWARRSLLDLTCAKVASMIKGNSITVFFVFVTHISPLYTSVMYTSVMYTSVMYTSVMYTSVMCTSVMCRKNSRADPVVPFCFHAHR